MTTSAPCDDMRLAEEHGSVLGGRVLGQEIRGRIVRQVERGACVVIDLEGVVAVSPSFADEIFGKLPLEVREDQVEFVNVSEELRDAQRMARAGRGNG